MSKENIYNQDIVPKSPREDKEEFIGKSKIERGLNFEIYRVSSNRKLLGIERESKFADDEHFPKFLRRALCFTTQKNMALEYRIEDKNILFKERGVDFLEESQNFSQSLSEPLRVILLSHEDLATFQQMLRGIVGSIEEKNNFFQNHTHNVQDVSPRMLRRAAEIMVLLPEGINEIPLNRGRKIAVQSIFEKKRQKTGGRDLVRTPGLFHEATLRHGNLKDPAQSIRFFEDKIKEARIILDGLRTEYWRKADVLLKEKIESLETKVRRWQEKIYEIEDKYEINRVGRRDFKTD